MKKTVFFSLVLTLALLIPRQSHAQSLATSSSYTALLSAYHKDGHAQFDFGDKKKKKKNSGGPDFQHALGASLFGALSTAGDDDNSALAYGITYFPSIRVAEFGDALSLRLGVAPSFGISGSVNSREGGSLSLMYELPVDVELHFGNQEMDGFGGHIGAGFAYNRISSTDFGSNKAYGPHFTAGIKGLFRGDMYTIRAGFLLNISNKLDEYGYDGKHVFSASIARYF